MDKVINKFELTIDGVYIHESFKMTEYVHEKHIENITCNKDTDEKVTISGDLWEKVKNGAVLSKTEFPTVTAYPVAVFYNGKVVSLYGKHPSKDGLLKPVKVLRTTIAKE